MNELLAGFLALLLLKVGIQILLVFLNLAEVRRHESGVPEAFAGSIDEPTYRKSIAYTRTRSHFQLVEYVFEAGILAFVLLTPWASRFFTFWMENVGSGIWLQAIGFFLLNVGLGMLSWPLDLYDTFRVEQRFGFNNTQLTLWFSDKIKGFAVGALIGIPLLALMLWLVQSLTLWWFWAFWVFFGFQFLMAVVYPIWIMPLFNRFEPLAEGSLRDRLMALAEKTGFQARTILVMDGSKRSGHSNAFFAGFGRWRRVVLFDTLISQLSEAELEAVLAHEIGHYKCGHIPRSLVLSGVAFFIGFMVLGWLAQMPVFVSSFGFTVEQGFLPVLFLFSILSGPILFWIAPVFNYLSRRNEFEADRFAVKAQEGNPLYLRDALRKLTQKNLSNLTPHPLFSAVYYSHPSILEREAALGQ
jgi:STE24 endopeptidase